MLFFLFYTTFISWYLLFCCCFLLLLFFGLFFYVLLTNSTPISLASVLLRSTYIKYSIDFIFLKKSREASSDRVFVLRPDIRPVPLSWESRVQYNSSPETSQLHVISSGKSSPRDLCLNTKTQLHSMTSKLQCWTPYAKQLTRQEHNPTH